MVINVFVDGSYSKITPNKTFGGVVILNENYEVISIRRVETTMHDFVKTNNAGGEVIASLMAITESSMICKDEESIVRIFYDYRGVRDFITGDYKAKSKGMIYYVQGVRNILNSNPNIKLEFIKVKSHSGNKFNDLVDLVAKGTIPNDYKKYEKTLVSIG